MKDFALMLKGDKKMIAVGQEDFDKNAPKTQAAAVNWLNTRIEDLTKHKRAIDAEVNVDRFAVAMGGHWARHPREKEATYDVGGQDVTFVFRDDVERKI